MIQVNRYDDGSRSIETDSGLILSNTTLVDGFNSLMTTTDFERVNYLCHDNGATTEEAEEIIARYKQNFTNI